MDVGSSSKMGTTMSPAPIASRARLLSSTCITYLLLAKAARNDLMTVECHDVVFAHDRKPLMLLILAVSQRWNSRVKPSDMPAQKLWLAQALLHVMRIQRPKLRYHIYDN